MKVRFLNLSIKDNQIKKRYKRAFDSFLDKGQFVLGKKVKSFENKISKIIKKKYTVGVSSGTNALYLALKSCGITNGDHVLVPCLSWLSTFTAVQKIGAIPIGVDIGEDLQINLDLIKKNITKKTKAIIIVHFTGYLKNYNKLKKFCINKKIKLIEDAAQSFGAIVLNKPSGSFGDFSCFSMNPMKVFAAIGDAGTVSTNDKKYYRKILSYRYAGTINKELAYYPELNHKIDTLQAIILMENLKFLKKIIKKRVQNASIYDKNLVSVIKKPPLRKNFQHVYYTYTILCKNRDKLKKYLERKNIETKIQHPYLIYQHPGLKNSFNYKKKFPVGNKIVNKILSIPVHEKLSQKEIKYVYNSINNFYAK